MANPSNPVQTFNSLLSFGPLVLVLRKMIAEGKPGARRLYGGLIAEFEAHPELLRPMAADALPTRHTDLLETVLSAIFPPSTSEQQGVYAITPPFTNEAVYASPGFAQQFMQEGDPLIHLPDRRTGSTLQRTSLALAYNLILQQFYSIPLPVRATTVHPFTDAETGLTRYYELRLNAQFVDVKISDPDYTVPGNFDPQHTLELEELAELFPLNHFSFEGLMVVDIADITGDQVITEIKNALLNINSFSNTEVYAELQQHVQSLVGLKDLRIGLTPIFRKNGLLLHTEAHQRQSLLLGTETPDALRNRLSGAAESLFRDSAQPLLFADLDAATVRVQPLLQVYYEQGGRSLILCPLKCEDGDLIGLLEIMSTEANRLEFAHLTRLQPAIQLFALALEKISENLELQIDKTIKEHFTAVQPAVEWKFTEAAFNYLQHREVSEMARMAAISFDEVFPLYGAIDIRNSSVERNNAIQLDLLEQLDLAQNVLERASRAVEFPLLNEFLYRVRSYRTSTADTLLSDDEMVIYDFMQGDLDRLMQQLRATYPQLRRLVDDYLNALDPQRKIVYHHRKAYEESITRINDSLDRFIDSEQQSAQEVYPHYFERYITDGLEFNIYIGQSLAPQRPFDEVYVRNLKLWQITLLARAARLTRTLEKRLSLPMQTTQLILAHSIPLSISFRRKERKFDVDGAYNIRYEIVKKRIDKVHLRDSEERLTQPGMIAIVYSQQRELAEYEQFIDFLINEGLLTGEIEHHELEDTQGITGLKAIRVAVNFEATDEKRQTSNDKRQTRDEKREKV